MRTRTHSQNMSTNNSAGDTAMASTTRNPILPPVALEDSTQAAILLAISVVSLLLIAPICVATYRISRTVPTFILFFSNTFSDMVLAISSCYSQVLALCVGSDEAFLLFNAQILVSTPWSLLTYCCQLHNPLIALNRASAVLFPLQYNRWWRRRVVLALTLGVWVANVVIVGVEMSVAVAVNRLKM